MYNVPSFTLARAVGGLLAYIWVQRLGKPTTPLIILASVRLSVYLLVLIAELTSVVTGFHFRRGLFEYCQFTFGRHESPASLDDADLEAMNTK